MPHWTFRKPKSLLMALLCAVAAFAAEPEAKQNSQPADTSAFSISDENVFSIVSIVLPHNSLRNSETLHNWPFFAFAAPSWAYSATAQYDASKLLTLKGLLGSDLSFAGIGFKLDISAELMHLLELGVQASTGSALNYKETATLMGVYDPEERNYRQDVIFTEYSYGLRYHASLTFPLLALLPKSREYPCILSYQPY